MPKRKHPRNPSQSPPSKKSDPERADGLGSDETVTNLIRTLTATYEKNRNLENATAMKQYMRNQFDFYGIKAPERRAIDRQVLEDCKPPSLKFLHCLGTECWKEEKREVQMFCIDVLSKHKGTMCGQSLVEAKSSLSIVEKLIRERSWWDTVDMLASSVVGEIVKKHQLSEVMDEWIKDENLWIRRTAILHQLKYKRDTNSEQLFRYCLQRSHEKEFFIQKAIGWALREYHRTNAKAVTKFVHQNKSKLAKLSVREALKHAKRI